MAGKTPTLLSLAGRMPTPLVLRLRMDADGGDADEFDRMNGISRMARGSVEEIAAVGTAQRYVVLLAMTTTSVILSEVEGSASANGRTRMRGRSFAALRMTLRGVL